VLQCVIGNAHATLVPKRFYPIPLGEYELLVYISLQLRPLYTMVRGCDHENVMRALKKTNPFHGNSKLIYVGAKLSNVM